MGKKPGQFYAATIFADHRRIARTEKHIQDYMDAPTAGDEQDPGPDQGDVSELEVKLTSLREHLEELKTREKAVKAHPDKQLSETDPDARLMKQSRSGSLVGYNVQTAVDTENKLIIAHEVTNSPTDRGQLLSMAELAKNALQVDKLTVLADRGYFKGTDIMSCAQMDIQALVPKPKTSISGARGLFAREAFIYEADKDQYRCPAGEICRGVIVVLSMG